MAIFGATLIGVSTACTQRNDADQSAAECGPEQLSASQAFTAADREFLVRVPSSGNSASETDRVWIGVHEDFDDVVATIENDMGLTVVDARPGNVVAACRIDGIELFADVLTAESLSDSDRDRFEENGWLQDTWTYIRFR